MNNHPRTPRSRSAFTVVEMLVVIGILAAVSLGVATIFQSVGETVAKGRKLSQLNQFAARIERVMREDFQALTRDGFLVIINKNAAGGNDIQLYRGDERDLDGNGFVGRPRRSDEIMFFARGDFVSQRRPIVPSMIASSNEAAIYYGHGQKRRPQIAQTDPGYQQPLNLFFNPEPWDNNYDATLDTRLGQRTPGFVNPNEFARDWALLRHVTLLTNPQGPGQQVPSELFGFSSDDPAQRPRLTDSDRQIMLQPAARSIFTSLNGSSQFDPATGDRINVSLYDLSYAGQASSADLYPLYLRASGMVDVVTQDIATIRTELQSLAAQNPQRFPGFYLNYNNAFGRLPTPTPPSGMTTRDFFEYNFYNLPTPPNPGDGFNLKLGKYNDLGVWNIAADVFDVNHARAIRSWMIDALPSAWNTSSGSGTVNSADFYAGIRYEDIPTRLLYDQTDFANTDRGRLERAYAEANQEMLGSSVFVPRCTEFIVEWSYGFVDHSRAVTDPQFKQIQWYGLERFVDSDNDGIIEFNGDDQRAATRYFNRGLTQAGNDPSRSDLPRPRGASSWLVTGVAPLSGSQPDVEAACFGFATHPGADVASGQTIEGGAWPWPKLIRITMTLGDPTDREVEETYQVIFEIPDAQ